MISVILPTRNPDVGRLRRTLAALAAQTLPRESWELLVVDNGSTPPLADTTRELAALGAGIVLEAKPGLTRARLAGLGRARGDVMVFVDDDNVLAPDFLAVADDLFANHPGLGAAGGPVRPAFDNVPPAWTEEFYGLLALRDLGPGEIIVRGGPTQPWPDCAPVGAGLCVRRAAAELYARALATDPRRLTLDRAGRSLASGGDSDLVFCVLHGNWDVGYFPTLRVTHLIPAARTDPRYLARLNEGIQRTWVRVLTLHGQCPWTPIPRWTVPLRCSRAWWRTQAWRGPAHHVRWRGLVGRFHGLADVSGNR